MTENVFTCQELSAYSPKVEHNKGPLDSVRVKKLFSATEENVLKVLASWKQYGVSALARGFLPAIHGENEIKPLLAPLVGANVDEIAVMNHLSVNLHLLMNSFYAPKGKNYSL